MDVVGSFWLRIADLRQGVNIIFEQNGVDSLNFYELVGGQRTILRATCMMYPQPTGSLETMYVGIYTYRRESMH